MNTQDAEARDPLRKVSSSNEMLPLLGDAWRDVPIRADDNLMKDLDLDDEDIDMSLIDAIAQRKGQSLGDYEQNSMYGKVYTARDLVMFFNEQPVAPSTK